MLSVFKELPNKRGMQRVEGCMHTKWDEATKNIDQNVNSVRVGISGSLMYPQHLEFFQIHSGFSINSK